MNIQTVIIIAGTVTLTFGAVLALLGMIYLVAQLSVTTLDFVCTISKVHRFVFRCLMNRKLCIYLLDEHERKLPTATNPEKATSDRSQG